MKEQQKVIEDPSEALKLLRYTRYDFNSCCFIFNDILSRKMKPIKFHPSVDSIVWKRWSSVWYEYISIMQMQKSRVLEEQQRCISCCLMNVWDEKRNKRITKLMHSKLNTDFRVSFRRLLNTDDSFIQFLSIFSLLIGSLENSAVDFNLCDDEDREFFLSWFYFHLRILQHQKRSLLERIFHASRHVAFNNYKFRLGQSTR